jgi:hypothetical protein
MSLPARSPRSRPANGRSTDDVSPLDKRIIEHLQADGRRPFTQIAPSSASRRPRSAPHEPPHRARILQVVGVTDPLKLGFTRWR